MSTENTTTAPQDRRAEIAELRRQWRLLHGRTCECKDCVTAREG